MYYSRPPSGETAELLVLIGLILQLIGGVVAVVLVAWVVGLTAAVTNPYIWVVGVAALIALVLVIAFLYVAYTYSYCRIKAADYEGAQTPTLIVGIVSLIFGVIPGILYLVAYVKLGDAVREARGPPAGPTQWAAPYGAHVACRGCGRIYFVGQYSFCPHCGQRFPP